MILFNLSLKSKELCKYLTENYQIKKDEYIEFDAMRQTAQCLGRVMRGKNDYGIMIMAEYRYARKKVYSKLPNWIKKMMKQSDIDVSTSHCIMMSKVFFKSMDQDFVLNPDSYFTQEKFDQIQQFQAKMEKQYMDDLNSRPETGPEENRPENCIGGGQSSNKMEEIHDETPQTGI